MIITCPRCFSSYKVPDGAMPPEGRRVRCSGCFFEWVEAPTPEVVGAFAPQGDYGDERGDDSFSGFSGAIRGREKAPGRMEDPDGAIDSVRDRMVRRGESQQRREEEAQKKKEQRAEKLKRSIVPFFQWTGLIVACVLVFFAVFREQIGVHSPFFSDLYEDIGLPVEGVNQWFVIDATSTGVVERAGEIVVPVFGTVKNVSRRERKTPQIQIYWLKPNGESGPSLLLHPAPALLEVGKTARFDGELVGVDMRQGGELKVVPYDADADVAAPLSAVKPAESEKDSTDEEGKPESGGHAEEQDHEGGE